MITTAGDLIVDHDVEVLGGANLLMQAAGSLLLGSGVEVSLRRADPTDAPMPPVAGAATLQAGQSLVLAAGASVVSEGGGIDLQAGLEGLALQVDAADEPTVWARIDSGGGDVRLAAAGGLTLTEVVAGQNLSLVAGGAVSSALAADTAVSTVTATQLRIDAGAGAGSVDRPLRADVARVAASTSAGDIRLSVPRALEIGPLDDMRFARVAATGLAAPLYDLEASGLRTGDDGGVAVQAQGSITMLSDPAVDGGVGIRAGSGGITLVARVVAADDGTVTDPGDLVLQADLRSGHVDAGVGGGDIVLTAGGDLRQSAGTLIGSGGGDVILRAGGQMVLASVVSAPYTARLSQQLPQRPEGGDVVIDADTVWRSAYDFTKPVVSARGLSLSVRSVSELSVAVDAVSGQVDEGGLSLIDLDGAGDHAGLTVQDLVVLAGDVTLRSNGALAIDRLRVAAAAGDTVTVSVESGGDLTLLRSALGAFDGVIGDLTLAAAGVITSSRLFTGTNRSDYRAGKGLRLGSALEFLDQDGEASESGVVVLLEPEALTEAAPPARPVPGATVFASASLFSVGEEGFFGPMDFTAASAQAPAGLFLSSPRYIAIAGELPDTLTTAPLSIDTDGVLLVAEGVALPEGAQVTTERWLVADGASLQLGAEDIGALVTDITTAEVAAPPIVRTAVGVLPGAVLVVPDMSSALVFPGADDGLGAFGNGSDHLTVTLSVAAEAGTLAADDRAGVTVTGSGSSLLTLAGTGAALSTFLADPLGLLRYTGQAAQTLAVSVLRIDPSSGLPLESRTAVGLYGASRAQSVVPVIGALPSRLWVTDASASPLTFAGAQFTGQGMLGLTLALPDAHVLDAGQGLSAQVQPGDGVTVLPGSTPQRLMLQGEASALEAFVALQGRIVYTGSVPVEGVAAALPLSVRLSSAAGESVVTAELRAPAQSTLQQAGATLRAPASLALTPGARVPVPFAADALAGAGRLTLQVLAEGGSVLHWPAAAELLGADGEPLQASGVQGEAVLTVSGTAEALNAWLSTGTGTLRVSGNANAALQLVLAAPGTPETLEQPGSPGIESRTSIALAYRGAEGLQTGLSLGLPQVFTVGAGAADIRLPATALSGAGLLDVELSLDSGELSWLAGGAGVTDSQGVALVAGTGQTLTARGTAADLNAWLSGSGALTADVDATATLSVRVAGATSSATAQARVELLAAQQVLAPLSVAMPAVLRVQPEGLTPVVFEQAAFGGAVDADGSRTFTLTLVAPAGAQVEVQPFDGLSVATATQTLDGLARQVTTISGDLETINAGFATFGVIGYRVVESGAGAGAPLERWGPRTRRRAAAARTTARRVGARSARAARTSARGTSARSGGGLASASTSAGGVSARSAEGRA